MDNPFEQLITSSRPRSASPELLEMLGHKAARAFLDKGIPLNQAVVQAVKDHPELGNEHIKRIVEFSNNVTFQERFQQDADKNVHFPVADPGVVLRDLKDGGSPGHESASVEDYATAPPRSGNMEKNDGILDDAFSDLNNRQEHDGIYGQGEPVEKNAYAHPTGEFSHADPIDDIIDMRENLLGARDRFAEAESHFYTMRKTAEDSLYEAVKVEVLSVDGAGLGGVIGALEKVASQENVAAALEPIVTRLVEAGVKSSVLEAGLEKRAGVHVNLDHPLIIHFTGMMKAAEQQIEAAMCRQEVEEGLEQTTNFLRKNAGLGLALNALGVAAAAPGAVQKAKAYNTGFKPEVQQAMATPVEQ